MTALCRLLLKQSTFFDQRKWDLNHQWPKKSNQILTKQFEKNKYLICRSRNLRPGHHHKIHFLGLFLKWHQYRLSRSNFSRNSSVTIWARLKIVDFFSNPSKNPEKTAAFQTRRYLRSKHNTAPRTTRGETELLSLICWEFVNLKEKALWRKIADFKNGTEWNQNWLTSS